MRWWKSLGMSLLMLGAAWLLLAPVGGVKYEAGAAQAAGVEVPNPSFETGQNGLPVGWSLSEAEAAASWVTGEGRTGDHCLSLTGKGDSSYYWQSSELRLRPGRTYRFTCWAKVAEGSTPGVLTVGTDLVNHDFSADTTWTKLSFVFANDKTGRPTRLHLGQWHLDGTVYYDDVRLEPVQVVNSHVTRLLDLGAGEFIEGDTYKHFPNWGGPATTYSRPLLGFDSNFNTNRFPMNSHSWLTYVYDLPGYTQVEGQVQLSMDYHQEGAVVVEYSTDGEVYHAFGRLDHNGRASFKLPQAAYPTTKLYLRLRSEGTFQVTNYGYVAKLQPAAEEPIVGRSLPVTLKQVAPDLDCRIMSINPPVPGKFSVVTFALLNKSDEAKHLKLTSRTVGETDKWEETSKDIIVLPPHKGARVRLAYKTLGVGNFKVEMLARENSSGALAFDVEWPIESSVLQSADYGHFLKQAAGVTCWWATAMHKISRDRPVPQATDEVEPVYLEAARNEFEPVQLVLSPQKKVQAASVQISDLKGPAGAVLQASNWTVKLVKYVFISHPTDSYGEVGYWPDPLPPVKGAFSLEEGRNQPLWLTVHVPKQQAPGLYTGAVKVHLDGESLEVPLKLRVFDFTLPDATHTETAYGVSPDMSWHGDLSLAQQEQVWDLYMQDCRDHRISPYAPYWKWAPTWDLGSPSFSAQLATFYARSKLLESPLCVVQSLPDRSTLAELRLVMTQYEEGVKGYNGTGVEWPATEALKDVKVVEQTPERVVVEYTAVRNSDGEALRPFEARCRATFLAGRPYFLLKVLRVKNTSSKPFEIQSLIEVLNPQRAQAKAVNTAHWGAWAWQDFAVGVLDYSESGKYNFDLRPGHGDVGLQVNAKLAPGEVWQGTLPAVAVFGVKLPGGEQSLAQAVQQLISQLQAGPAPLAGQKLEFTLKEKGQLKIDYTKFDEYMHKYVDGYHFTAFNVPIRGFMPSSLGGAPRFTPEYDRLHKLLFGAITQHLKDKGWLAKAYAYWYDEPRREDYPYVKKGMDLLKQDCPGLRRLLTEQVEPDLYGAVDLWVPVLYMYNPEKCQTRQQVGEQVWWYVCTGPKAPYPNNFIDHPALNHRIRFWMMTKYGVEGSLYWSATYWRGEGYKPRSPWLEPMSVNPGGGFWGNGDGMLLYPPLPEKSKQPLVCGPVDSIRWEILREGLEDREYFYLLQQVIETTHDSDRRAEAQRLLDEVKGTAESLTRYTHDPAVLARIRHEIGEFLSES